MSSLSEYEQERLKRLAENKKMLMELQITSPIEKKPKRKRAAIDGADKLLSSAKKSKTAETPLRVTTRARARVENGDTSPTTDKKMLVYQPTLGKLPAQQFSPCFFVVKLFQRIDDVTALSSPYDRQRRAGPLLTSDVYEVSITEGGTTVNSEHEGGEKFLRSLLSLSVAKSSTAVEDVQTWKGIEKWEPILRKVTKDRIYSLLVHPTQDKVLCAAGDKDGRIGFWDATSNSVHVFRPHVKSVAALAWGSGSSQSGTTLLSAAYDGQLRSIDLAHDTEKGVEFDVFYEDHDGNMLSSLVVSKDGNLAYVADNQGGLAQVDTRSKDFSHMIVHDKKTTCVHIHPHDEWLVMTASLDCTIKIFDIRMKSTGKSTNAPKALSELSHDQGISSAYFSPKTGSHILSTGNDDIIAIWSGYDNSKSFSKPPARTLKISHNNKTGRWISPFRANFDPTESLIAVGDMKRAIQLYDAKRGSLHNYLQNDDLLTAIPSHTIFHPTLELLIAATASGRVYLYGLKEKNSHLAAPSLLVEQESEDSE